MRTTALLCCLLYQLVLLAQPVDPAQSFEWVSAFEQTPTLMLESNLRELNKLHDVEPWLEGTVSVNGGPAFPVKVKARGHMRKQTCEFPPLKIRFDALTPVDDSLSERSELKLVHPCFSDELNERLILKEYLCYKLYNILTDQSFRAQLIKLQLLQSGKEKASLARYAFLIESELAVAQRAEGRPYSPHYLPLNRLEPRNLDRMALFEYMIGNTDWSVETRHNVKLLAWKERFPAAVPYDFDYSGIVNASYAVPQKGVPIQSVTERWFLGLCRNEAEIRPVIQEFLDKKEALLACVNSFELLLPSERRQMIAYMQSFFDVIESPSKTSKQILEQCKVK
ncbi:MAG: hypothetical protein ACOYNO_09470 [Saprospiraceae bacterium]